MIYLHVPFCKSFCTYCDFYSEIICPGKERQFETYTDGVCDEIRRRRAEIEESDNPHTLYIGGGTPSVLPFRCLRRIVDEIGSGPYEEFTVEVNPEDIVTLGETYLSSLRSLGVNRISMGVQSLDDCILTWMNRRHDSARAARAFKMLREAGFSNISVDVIFGISHLTGQMLSQTLESILSWSPEHISAYQLTVEDGSGLARMIEEGLYTEASDEQCRTQYDLICRVLKESGYHHYEISNWAKPGFEAIHNSAYWTRAPYVGLGPGAHSLRGRDIRSWNTEELSGWTSEQERLGEEEIREERLMLGLRTDKGVDGIVIPERDWFISDSIIESYL